MLATQPGRSSGKATQPGRGRGRSGQGGGEHVNERTLGCVSERAEPTTPAWTANAAADYVAGIASPISWP